MTDDGATNDGETDDGATTDADLRGGSYDEWVVSLAESGFYLECGNGHGSLPPRRVCPECGETDLTERDLPETGEVATFSEVHVATPSFADETPYVTAVVEFGPVRLTGVLRELVADEVSIGDSVRPDVEIDGPDGQALVVFKPA